MIKSNLRNRSNLTILLCEGDFKDWNLKSPKGSFIETKDKQKEIEKKTKLEKKVEQLKKST